MTIRTLVPVAFAVGLALALAWIVSAQALEPGRTPQVTEGAARTGDQALRQATRLALAPRLSVTPAYTLYLPLGARNYDGLPAFGYGIGVDRLGDAESNMAHIQTLGLEWVKLWMDWADVEPSQGSYDWTPWDNLIEAYHAPEAKVLLNVMTAPDWSRAGQDLNVDGPPNDPQDFASFLGALASRYCGSSVQAIEVWSDQNLHYAWGNLKIDPAAYMSLLKPAYQAIKDACPAMVVVSGGPTPTGAPPPRAMDDFAYLEGMYENGLKAYSDAVGAHHYGYNVAPWISGGQDACDFITQQGSTFRGPCNTLHHSWSFYATLNGYYRITQIYGDNQKRIWPTEFGWAAADDAPAECAYALDNSYQEQAEWTVEAFRWGKESGWIGPMFLFNLDYGATATNHPPAFWSLLRPGGPVPAYNAISDIPK